MIEILFVSERSHLFGEFKSGIESSGEVLIKKASSGKKALEAIGLLKVHLVVVDEILKDISGTVFAKKLVSVNPMVNCALVSSFSPDEFHEKTEGLGLLMQIPMPPSKNDGIKLMEKLKEILALTGVLSADLS